MAGPSGATTLINLMRETAWGVPPTGNWHQVNAYSLDMRPREPFQNDPLLGQGREQQDPARDVLDVTPQVEVPVDLRGIGHWLTSLLGLPTTTGTGPGPYTHVWKSGGTPESYSIEMVNPEAGPSYFRSAGYKSNTMQASFAPRGRASLRFDGISKDYVEAGTSAAGASVPIVHTSFSHFQGALTRDASPLARVTAAEFRYNNNLEGDRFIGGGGALGDLTANEAMFDGSITTRFVDRSMFDWATLRLNADLKMAFTSGANSISFDGKRVWLERSGGGATGPRGISAQFNLMGSKDPTALASLVVTLINDVASYAA
jgi:hypothetical protein